MKEIIHFDGKLVRQQEEENCSDSVTRGDFFLGINKSENLTESEQGHESFGIL